LPEGRIGLVLPSRREPAVVTLFEYIDQGSH
jgi:hypothetical protein